MCVRVCVCSGRWLRRSRRCLRSPVSLISAICSVSSDSPSTPPSATELTWAFLQCYKQCYRVLGRPDRIVCLCVGCICVQGDRCTWDSHLHCEPQRRTHPRKDQRKQVLVRSVKALKEVFSAYQGCIHLIKNTVESVKHYYNLKQLFSIWTVIYFCDTQLYFQHHYSSLQCHMIFRNHNNMLIYCSRHISDYYQCWKQLCCTIFYFSGFFDL